MQTSEFIEWIKDELIKEKELEVGMLRLDKIHPIISGNKYFKLKYFLEEARKNKKDTVISFGGYYSNHLHAIAYACNECGLKSVGYVRGIEPPVINDTLKDCIKYGMNLQFILHSEFENIQQEISSNTPSNAQLIPMGGQGILGMKGASEILNFKGVNEFDYIIAAAGTGTMAAGLIHKLEKHQQLILISALKNNLSLKDEILTIQPLLAKKEQQVSIFFDFHCGGFGKLNEQLIDKMNWFYNQHMIPTDFVYTGKMMLGFYELLNRNYFQKETKILLIHSGGIQGNRSLQVGRLKF